MIGHKIILAGVDGSGKSTLAKKLQMQKKQNFDMDYKIVHSTRNTQNDLEYFITLLNSEDNIIFDRFYADQFVYQTTEQRKDYNWLSLVDLYVVESNIIKNNHECILVDTDLNLCLMSCLKDSDDSLYNMKYIEQLCNRYWYFTQFISEVNWEIFKNDYVG